MNSPKFVLMVQILLESGFPDLVDAALQFIFQQSSNCNQGFEAVSAVDDVDVVVNTIEDLITISSEQPLSKVINIRCTFGTSSVCLPACLFYVQ